MDAGATALLRRNEDVNNMMAGAHFQKAALERQLLMLIHEQRKRKDECEISDFGKQRP